MPRARHPPDGCRAAASFPRPRTRGRLANDELRKLRAGGEMNASGIAARERRVARRRLARRHERRQRIVALRRERAASGTRTCPMASGNCPARTARRPPARPAAASRRAFSGPSRCRAARGSRGRRPARARSSSLSPKQASVVAHPRGEQAEDLGVAASPRRAARSPDCWPARAGGRTSGGRRSARVAWSRAAGCRRSRRCRSGRSRGRRRTGPRARSPRVTFAESGATATGFEL